jgi:hypothetical protein
VFQGWTDHPSIVWFKSESGFVAYTRYAFRQRHSCFIILRRWGVLICRIARPTSCATTRLHHVYLYLTALNADVMSFGFNSACMPPLGCYITTSYTLRVCFDDQGAKHGHIPLLRTASFGISGLLQFTTDHSWQLHSIKAIIKACTAPSLSHIPFVVVTQCNSLCVRGICSVPSTRGMLRGAALTYSSKQPSTCHASH